GYSAASGFPAEGTLAEGTVAHRVVSPSPAAPPPAGPRLDERCVEAARRFAETPASFAETTSPPPRSPPRASAAGPAPAPAASRPKPVATSGAPTPTPAREVARLAGSAAHVALQRWDLGNGAALRRAAAAEVARLVEETPAIRSGGGELLREA